MSTKSEPLIRIDLRQLSLRSLIILSTIAIFIVSSQILVQIELQRQSATADVINVAGRQRMLSQRIAKDALALQFEKDEAAQAAYLRELQESVSTWQRVMTGLQAGDNELDLPGNNSAQVAALFAALQTSYAPILAAANCLPNALTGKLVDSSCSQNVDGNVRTILDHEDTFLAGMDAIVNQYGVESKTNVQQLKVLQIAIVLLLLTLLVLLRLSVFRITVGKIKQETEQLLQTQEELRLSEQRYRLLMENSTDMISQHTPDGITSYMSLACRNVLDYEPEELIGRSIFEFVHPDDLGARQPSQLSMFALPEAKPFSYRAQRKNGDPIWLETTIHSIPNAETGASQEIVAVTREIGDRKQAENRIKELAQFQQAILDSANVSIIATDLNGIIRTFNMAAQNWLGYSAEEMLGKQTPAILHDAAEMADRAAALSTELGTEIKPGFDVFIAKAQHGIADESEWTYIRKDGTHLSVQLSVTALHDDKGSVTGYLGIASDITDRKEAERTVQGLIARYQALFDYAQDSIFIIDPETLRFVDVNHSAARRLGYTRDELMQLTTQDINPFGDAPQPGEFRKQLLRQGNTVVERQHRRKDGTIMSVEISSRLIYYNDQEVVQSFVRDITERKHVQQELEESESRYRSIIAAMAEGVIIRDADGSIRTYNASAQRILGLTHEEMMGQQIANPTVRFVYEDDTTFPTEKSPGLVTLRTGQAQQNVVMGLQRPDGTTTWITISTEPILYADGTTLGAVTSFVDITDRKRIEVALAAARDQALEASRLKSTFLATMSHEIRTPMNGVIGMIELLLESNLDEQQRKMLEVMQTSGHTLLNIINDTLDFSKIEAGRIILEQHDFEPLRLVEGVVSVLASQAQSKYLSLMTLVEPDVPALLYGDDTRLHQILINLVGNAIKFTEQGEILVHAMLEATTATQATVRLSVSDTGIGLSAEARAHLFEPFSQADSTTTRRYGGTGLGLAICKRLVEFMGGEIQVESEPGQGATFWFRIPFTLPENVPQIPGNIEPESDLQDTKVLIVDDSTSARLILNRYLSKMKARSGTASSAKRALEELHKAIAANDPYDVAVIDLVMPGVDGMTLAKAIKQDPVIAYTPLIMITAFNASDSRQEALDSGFIAYLSKPVRQAHLFKAIKERNNPDLTIVVDHKPILPPKDPLVPNQRILLAEDNQINQLVASMQLERLGYKVDIVGTGEEALNIIARQHYDLILMDCNMPEMDGFEATRRIREQEADRHTHARIIAMTANAMQGDREACLRAGMDDYISKPIALMDLKQTLERWLNPNGPIEPIAVATSTAPQVLVTLDTETLDNLCKLSKRSKAVVLPKLIDNFLSNTPTLLIDLRTAATREDVPALQRAAHTLKSSSASYGAVRLAELCRMLETAARTGEVLAGLQQVEEIEAEYVNVKSALEQQLQEGI